MIILIYLFKLLYNALIIFLSKKRNIKIKIYYSFFKYCKISIKYISFLIIQIFTIKWL